MTTTSQVREWWAPACKANAADLTPAYQALDAQFKKHNYRPRSGVTGAFNCRQITGGTNFSLHAYDPDGFFTFWSGVRVTKALAVDVNWDTNPYGPVLKTDMPMAMIEDIESIKTKNGKQVFRWGGRYSGNKDAMHFEIIVSPEDLKTGIVVPSAPVKEPDEEEEEVQTWFIWLRDNRAATATVKPVAGTHLYAVTGGQAVWQSADSFNIAKYLSGLAKKPLTVIGSKTNPEPTVDKPTWAPTKTNAWMEGMTFLNGPLKGLR